MVRFALTLDSCLAIGWDTMLEKLDAAKIRHSKNIARSFITLDNGSKIKFAGVDASEKEMKKVLGQKLRKASIDECGSITVKVNKLVNQMIDPALVDLAPYSWLSLLGTPENIPNTFFEKVTSGKESSLDWEVFKWTAYDNPFMAKQWAAKIADMTNRNPDIVNTGWFKTHYLNMWCSDDDLLIIPNVNVIDDLPLEKYHCVLGVDLGFNDANAFSVIAWDYDHPSAYIIKSYKESGMDFTATANEIKKLQSKYPISKVVIDGANKQGVMEMRQRHSLNLDAADKTDKHVYLKLLKDDFTAKRLFTINSECDEFVEESQSLQWKDELKLKEDDRCQNHTTDSVLYAWREARHYYYAEPEEKPSVDSDKYMDEYEKRLAQSKQIEEESWTQDLTSLLDF
jgi:phage terminase large subunit